MLVGKVEASKIVVRAIPDSPLRRRFHTPSMEWPIGVTQPIPVMTTRFMGLVDSSQETEDSRVNSPRRLRGSMHRAFDSPRRVASGARRFDRSPGLGRG